MQKIHILYNNDSLEKVALFYKKNKNDIVLSENKFDGYPFFIIENGSDDVLLILNDNKKFCCKLSDNSQFEKIKDNYEVIASTGTKKGDYLLLKKSQNFIHIVKPKETIEELAEKYKTSIKEIVEINDLKTNKLFIGQQIKL